MLTAEKGVVMSGQPSAFAIEAALSALKVARDQIADNDLVLDEAELTTALEASSKDVEDILHRMLRAAQYCENMGIEATRRAAQVRGRAARFERRENVLRAQIIDLMQVLGRRRFVRGDVGCRVSPGPESLEITDPSLLDKKYFNDPSPPTVNKRALRDDLEQGIVIEGAKLLDAKAILFIEGK